MKSKNSNIQTITVTPKNAGQRIDNFLRVKFKYIPLNTIYRILRKGEVRLNKKRIKPKYKIENGDQIRIPPICVSKSSEKTISLSQRNNITSLLENSILYEDECLLVLNKPFGTAVHGGSNLNFGIIENLRALYKKVEFLELVHRIDRTTSGVLLIAKKRSALRSLHEQLREKNIQKEYLALVHGNWPSNLKKIQAPLLKKNQNKHMVKVDQKGKSSETLFRIEERFPLVTLIKAIPITGRTHQIRVHSLHAGHPIVFDDRYGNRNSDHKFTQTNLNRLFLHAETLTFKHPKNHQILKITAPLDKELKNCLNMLRKKST